MFIKAEKMVYSIDQNARKRIFGRAKKKLDNLERFSYII